MHRSRPARWALGIMGAAALAACGGGGDAGAGPQASAAPAAASAAGVANAPGSASMAPATAPSPEAAIALSLSRSSIRNALRDAREDVRDAVRDVREDLGDALQDARDDLGNAVQDLRGDVRDELSRLAERAVGDEDWLRRIVALSHSEHRVLARLGQALLDAGVDLADPAVAPSGQSLAGVPPEERRLHDVIPYRLSDADAAATTFEPMPPAAGDTVDMATTSRWAGVLEGAAYRIEVPAHWNGELVMYAHGYPGEGLTLEPTDSAIRRWLVQNGFAWAASSYSRNSYDVRAGIEDTNLLALNFTAIAAARGRPLAPPMRTYIIGHSMGGHVAAAAVEAETQATARNKVRYDGALPMCGAVGDTALFDTYAAMQGAAHVLGGHPAVPLDRWVTIRDPVTAALFGATFDTPQVQPNGPAGQAYFSVLQNLTGGPRPLFDLGYSEGGSLRAPWELFGLTTAAVGLTTQPTADTTAVVFEVDGDTALSAQLNATAPRAAATQEANRARSDGLRWIPKVNGQLMAPVLSIHTLGDLFVPFNMQQVYRQRADANGTGGFLVQRAIRGAAHCDFTNAEMARAFADLVAWVRQGSKPAGDDVMTAATVAQPGYGCTFTDDTLHADDREATRRMRGLIAQRGRQCAAAPGN